jgi:hypothetical protein
MTITLEGFQVEGVNHFASSFHAMNGDDPGLGKTIQAIAAAQAVGAKRVLVTTPASVRSSWAWHLKEMGVPNREGWDIISYNQAHSVKLQAAYDVWIGDEIHFCKTLSSKRTQAVFGAGGLARRARYKWPMSGTWAPNYRPVELYPVLKALHPAFKDMTFGRYANEYCGAFWDGRGLNVKGASRLEELRDRIGGFMLRRTEQEVFSDRLEPLIILAPLTLTAEDQREIWEAEDEIGGREMRISSRYEQFSQLGDTSRLLRLLGVAKTRQVVAYVQDLLETVDKVVVFAHHKDVMASLFDSFNALGYLPTVYKGGMSDASKDAALSAFKRGGCRVFIGQDQAAGTGINGLQEVCSTAVFAEWAWTPGETAQRIRRLARMGQKDPLVKAHVLFAAGTLDEVMVQVHNRKERVGEELFKEEIWKLI